MGALCASKENHPETNTDKSQKKLKKKPSNEVMPSTTRKKSTSSIYKNNDQDIHHQNNKNNKNHNHHNSYSRHSHKSKAPPMPRITSNQVYQDSVQTFTNSESAPLFDREANHAMQNKNINKQNRKYRTLSDTQTDQSDKSDKEEIDCLTPITVTRTQSDSQSQSQINRLNTYEQKKLLDTELESSMDGELVKQDTGKVFGGHTSVVGDSGNHLTISRHSTHSTHSNQSNVSNYSNRSSNKSAVRNRGFDINALKKGTREQEEDDEFQDSIDGDNINNRYRDGRNLSLASGLKLDTSLRAGNNNYNDRISQSRYGDTSVASVLSVASTSNVIGNAGTAGAATSVFSIRSNDSILFDWDPNVTSNNNNNDSQINAIKQVRNEYYDNSSLKSPTLSDGIISAQTSADPI